MNLERVGHALSDHGAESRIIEPVSGHNGSLWLRIVVMLGGMVVSLAVIPCRLRLSHHRCQKCLHLGGVHW